MRSIRGHQRPEVFVGDDFKVRDLSLLHRLRLFKANARSIRVFHFFNRTVFFGFKSFSDFAWQSWSLWFRPELDLASCSKQVEMGKVPAGEQKISEQRRCCRVKTWRWRRNRLARLYCCLDYRFVPRRVGTQSHWQPNERENKTDKFRHRLPVSFRKKRECKAIWQQSIDKLSFRRQNAHQEKLWKSQYQCLGANLILKTG